MRIYTRGGDDGTTGLLYGGRVDKSDPRTEAVLTLSGPLPVGSSDRLTVRPTVADAAGNPLAAAFGRDFASMKR